jgi:hypothetical protein
VLIAACAPAKTTEGSKEGAQPASKSGVYGDYDARAKDQWKRLPADHKKGTLVTQADWYKILGDVPEPSIWRRLWAAGAI